MDKFIITKDSVKKIKRFNYEGRTIEFKIKPIPAGEEPVSWIKDAVNQIIQQGVEGVDPTDQVGFSFCSKDFSRGEGWIKFRLASEVMIDDVWGIISKVYQSNSTGLNTETFCLGITTVKMPVGKGNDKPNRYNTYEEECSMRKGLVVVNNKDNICLARALVVAKAHVDKDPEYAKIRKDTRKIQTVKALKLIEDANVKIPEGGAGIAELDQFQSLLKGYRITVYKYGTKGRDVIYEGSGDKRLNLLHHDGHYNVITSITASFCCSYFCEDCKVPYNNKNKHRCQATCSACQQTPACPEAKRIRCADCHRSFRGMVCYDNHRREGSLSKGNVCTQITQCNDCLKVVKSNRSHICGEIYCKICQMHQPEGHMCYIQPDTKAPKSKDVLFIFYDLETRQETMLEDGNHLHQPNLCVFKQYCDACMDAETNLCHKCGPRLQILKSDNPVERFSEYVLNQRKVFKQVIAVAHNAGGFDGQFILNYILTKTIITPKLITRGKKIILMEVDNVKFLDSLNYFPMRLAVLPKAFGLGDDLKKGYFPYLFNTKKNENYVGPLPSLEFFNPDTMSIDSREKFMQWYDDHKHDVFDMQKEIVEYCVSDVDILAKACLKFRHQLLDIGNVDPFIEACTIASSCNKVYRRNFLKPNTIGIIPKNGYRWRDNQSKIAIQWLVWEERQRGINILHAAKQSEVILKGVKVDGFSTETNEIFQFLGCYFHGHDSCLKYDREKALHDNPAETLNSRYEKTIATTERLKSFGYTVNEMWECDFRKHLRDSEEMRSFTESHPLVISTPLNPRDAFYGGRTGNTVEYYKVKEGEQIRYADVCSLYPWVCKYGKFPVGHPKVHTGDECSKLDLGTTEGLIRCKILPPDKLYHPVLPCKMNDKLMFVLCRTCGTTMHQNDCNHTIEERALSGVWVMDEVRKAMERGYRMLEIYEIWEYMIEQYDKNSRTGGLFSEMMNTFIKAKQQASGFPKNCYSRREKDKYIDSFLEREDVKMEYIDIIENPGLRSLAKLMLNSFWGKFGQKENQPKTDIVNDASKLFSMLANPSMIVNGLLPVNEKTLVVNYQFKEEAYDPLTTVNVVIASYVTTQARLKLYSYLEQLGDRVVYYDTDSVLYVSKPCESDIVIGNYVGDMTDELENFGPGTYITEFVSGGPKNYAYKMYHPQQHTETVLCKVKGISLNYAASQLINFDTIKDMVLKKSTEYISILSKNIRRTKIHEVVTKEETKIYRINSTKRRFLADHTSVPYGSKILRTE